MKEVSFIRRNIDKWKDVEKCVARINSASPDKVAETYMDVTSDLSFSQCHFPHSRITLYLNNLAYSIHHQIYKNKRETWRRVGTFWTKDIPEVMATSQKALLLSFIVFLVSGIVGALATLHDPNFARNIMGDSYVEMTLRNIAQGDPMGVYGNSDEYGMFLQITLNNIMVSFYIFAFGLLTGFGTAYMLIVNGIMLGCFQAFLYQQGVMWNSMLAIWLHGTLEISAIIIAGAASFILGSGWLFPGTYSRGASFMHGAKKGIKIIVGLVPIFIIAGFIESYFTRYTQTATWIRLSFILLCLAFVLFYYVIIPIKIYYGKGRR